MNALAEYTQDAALFAEAASDDAIAAAEAASAFSNATRWVSGTVYADGAVVWSPITYLSYRRKGAGAGATDPSADSGPAGNWVLQDKGPVGALFSINANTTAVRFATYELGNAALTLTLPAAPLVGDWVGVIPSGLPVSGQVIGRNAKNIMGLAENMTVDVDAIPFRLVYVGVTRGWVISA
ncbi:hypothetical protein D3C71_1182610 [compost metagenome]